MWNKYLLKIFVFVTFCTSVCFGQSLNVKVLNKFRNNLPVVQAELMLMKSGTEFQNGFSDTLGRYSFMLEDSGCYTLIISLPPYPKNIIEAICIDSMDKEVTTFLDFDPATYELNELSYKYFRFFPLDSAKKLDVKQLRFVDGSFQSLNEFPHELKRMPKITILQLEGNNLKKIPKRIIRNKNLVILDLRNNPIEKDTFEKYKKMRKDLTIIF